MQKTDSQLITEANVIRDEVAAGANTALRVGTMLDNVIDSKINNDKIDTNIQLGTSNTVVPSQNAVKTYVDGVTTGVLNDRGNYDASTNVFPSTGGSGAGGLIQKGDLWYVSVAGTLGGSPVLVGYSIRALATAPGQTNTNWAISNVGLGYVPEDSLNKSNDTTMGGVTPSNTLFPTQEAVNTFVNSQITAAVPYTPENVDNKNSNPGIIAAPTSTVFYPSNKAVADYLNNVIDLQLVTNNGNTTTHDIHVVDAIITSESNVDAGLSYLSRNNGESGILGLVNAAGKKGEVKSQNLSGDRTLQLPDEDGTLVIDAPSTGFTYGRNNATWVPIANNSMQTVKVTLNSTDIQNLSTAYFDLLPAQGVGTMINVVKVWIKWNFGTTPYVGGGTVTIYYGNGVGSLPQVTNPLANIFNSGSLIIRPTMNTTAYYCAPNTIENVPITIISTAAQTGGDGTMDVYLTYDIITL